MNSKYSISRFATGTLAAFAALLLTTACHDDFGYQNEAGQRIAFKLTAAEAWHNGMSVNENAPTARCTSVQELSGDGDTQLYLHTVVADNPVAEPELTSRGTPITSTKAFQDTYDKFSLSGILVTDGNSVKDLKPEFAYNLSYNSTSGLRTDGEQLLWPWTGSVHYFAFAPTIASFGENSPLKISEDSHLGAPILTYTVPTVVTKQVDLMTATKIATLPSENLEFKHALTAVQIKCAEDMLAGTITEVTISGIYGTGSLKIGSDTWTFTDEATAEYKITQDITLSPSTDEEVADKIHAPEGTPIAGTPITDPDAVDDNLTFLLLPQVLPDGATMTIKFTDDVSKTERTLTGSIAGHTWEAGKIVTYSISPKSIHIIAKVDFSKNGITDKNPTGDIMPYSGVWYDVQYNPAKVEIVQAGVATKQIKEIPIDDISYQYQIEGDEDWADCKTDANGLLTIAPQSAYEKMSSGFQSGEAGSEASPVSLTVNGETANCYLVDQAGYYSLPLVYGNGNVADPVESTSNTPESISDPEEENPSDPTKNATGLKYYPQHDDGRMPSDGKISGAEDAVLCWQDSPDLIDPASVKVVNGNLAFHIRKETLAQGNALLAVRNAAKQIIWSWHIWVTPHKSEFYSGFYTSTSGTYSYKLSAKYNLGWCDSHGHNAARKFKLRAVVDMSAYGGKNEVEIGTFTQDVFKGSDAGDNTYYQWGRKDPMLGGIYNVHTQKYTYYKKGDTTKDPDENEFTMENKQVFNQYNQDDCNYSFCKNPGDMIYDYGAIGTLGEASKGVTIGYAIQHPYMFVTNSKEYLEPKGGQYNADGTLKPYDPTTGTGYTASTGEGFNYRNHWHIPYVVKPVAYLNTDAHILFNAWNSDATGHGYTYSVSSENLHFNADKGKKSVYDPCPPKFQVPPIHALKAVYDKMTTTTASYADNVWTITSDGSSITFPLTGVRNYALRPTEWKTVVLTGSGLNYEEFYKISMPAFRMLTFLSSATIVEKEAYNAYQVLIFYIDRTNRANDPGTSNLKKVVGPSSNSYGLSVRPMYSPDTSK